MRPLRHKLDVAGAARIRPELADADIVHTPRPAHGLARATACPGGRPLTPSTRSTACRTSSSRGSAGRSRSRILRVSRGRLFWLEHGSAAHGGAAQPPGNGCRSLPGARRLCNRGTAFRRRRIHVIPNGVAGSKARARPAHDPRRDRNRGSAGAAQGGRRPARGERSAQDPHRLVIFGDGSLRRELEAQADAIGLARRVPRLRPRPRGTDRGARRVRPAEPRRELADCDSRGDGFSSARCGHFRRRRPRGRRRR